MIYPGPSLKDKNELRDKIAADTKAFLQGRSSIKKFERRTVPKVDVKSYSLEGAAKLIEISVDEIREAIVAEKLKCVRNVRQTSVIEHGALMEFRDTRKGVSHAKND